MKNFMFPGIGGRRAEGPRRHRIGRGLVARALPWILLFAPAVSTADGLAGRVENSKGDPVSGAMVSARNRALDWSTTVYTDARGRFRIPDLVGGTYDVRVRRFPFRDAMVMGFEAPASAPLELTVETETDDYDRMAALPSNRWFALAVEKFPTEAMREEFTRQCTYCHQQGSWATRAERSHEEWEKIFSLMARMGGQVSADTRKAIPELLNSVYEPKEAIAKLKRQLELHPLPNPSGFPAVIDEWELGNRGSELHDLMVHPSGFVYAVDGMRDRLYRLDPHTGERRTFDVPTAGLPIGGVLPNYLIPPNVEPRVAPHSLQTAPDGKIWITLCAGNKIGVFDPTTEQFELIDQEDGLFPHTLRFDSKGRVWYTLALSNHVGMIDPATREQRTIRLPGRTWTQSISAWLTPILLRSFRWIPYPETASLDSLPPVPYGIDIAPDGGVWFSQLYSHRVGRIDPETGRYEFFETPYPAPRRIRFDSKGDLWIPGFSSGVITRFDPKTRQFRSWELPTGPKGSETPYALNVDRKTDTVWIAGTNSDTLIRFDSETEEFTVYPLPYRVTYMREIDFDEEGGVWTSNSNTPGWHIESDNPHVIRLLPDGQPDSRRASR